MKKSIALLGLVVAACAAQTRHPVSGPPLTAVTEDEAAALLNDLRLDLKDVSLEPIGGKSLEPRVEDGQLLAEIASSQLFEEGNAQLRAEALKPLAEIAQDIAARGGCVVQVVGLGRSDDDLIESRAASIADNLAHHSIAPSRLRFESRRIDQGDDRIVLVLKPVIIGREPPAWTPPVLGE
jgi:flagellar motor protein MotB